MTYAGGPSDVRQYQCSVCGANTYVTWCPETGEELYENRTTHKNGICYNKKILNCGKTEQTIESAKIVF